VRGSGSPAAVQVSVGRVRTIPAYRDSRTYRGYSVLVTIGVEEEFLLVDPASCRTAGRAGAVLKRAASSPRPRGSALHSELLSTQVEFATGVCTTLDELRRQLVEGRRLLSAAARTEGLRLVSSGTAVLSDLDVPITEGDRFDRIAGIYAQVLTDYQVSGCHVHVGVPDRDTAVAVVNHLSVWLPVLLALSANSPFDQGRDTGYASWRMIQQSRLPGSGLTPWFGSAAEYDSAVGRLVDVGVLVDDTMTFWLARPSPRYPTVEVRVADATATVDEAVLQASVTEALVRHALRELAAGKEARPIPAQLAAAAIWTAARYGLTGPAVDLRSGMRVPMWSLLTELFRMVSLDIQSAGQRWRQAGDPRAVVDRLSELFVPEEK
jgi:glutamate---cysteine ligase / carboxylate-amine ligase